MRIAIASLPEPFRSALKEASRKRDCYVYTYRGGGTVLTGWDDGSRDEYAWASSNGRAVLASFERDPNTMGDPFGQRRILPLVPPAGMVGLIRYGTSRGKPATPALYFADPARYSEALRIIGAAPAA